MTNSKLNQNQEIISPDKVINAIIELVKKYELERIEKEMEKKISQAKTPHERGKIFENLPTCQISRTVKEITEGKISSKELVSILQERLEISQEKAEKLANDLKEKVLILAQGLLVLVEEKINKEIIARPKKNSIRKSTDEPSISLEKDAY